MASRAGRPGCLGRLVIGLMVMVLAYAFSLLVAPPVLTVTRMVVLLPELIELPVRPLSLFTAQPQRITMTYGLLQDRMDIYFPAELRPGQRVPAVVLALGVHPPPIDAPEITRVAEAMARAGVVVGVPDSSRLRYLDVVPEEPAHLAEAVLLVMARPEVDPARVGLAGFSAGASMALVAAADPRIAADLHYLSSFGGYADTDLLLIDVATRTMVLDGQVRPWDADFGVRSDVLTLFLNALDVSTDERAQLERQLRPVVEVAEPPTGPQEDFAAQLEGDRLVTYLLFMAPDRPAARSALAGASPALRANLDGISPMAFIDQVLVPVYLLHGDGDTAIPVSHSVLLSEALGERTARFTRFGRFAHGQPGQEGLGLEDIPDIWELTLYLNSVVAAATE